MREGAKGRKHPLSMVRYSPEGITGVRSAFTRSTSVILNNDFLLCRPVGVIILRQTSCLKLLEEMPNICAAVAESTTLFSIICLSYTAHGSSTGSSIGLLCCITAGSAELRGTIPYESAFICIDFISSLSLFV